MDLTEKKRKIDTLARVTAILEQSFQFRTFGKRVCFVSETGTPFQVFAFPGQPALAIEYAENAEDAAIGRFEDGDLFYLDDYVSDEAMVKAMVEEIEG